MYAKTVRRSWVPSVVRVQCSNAWEASLAISEVSRDLSVYNL